LTSVQRDDIVAIRNDKEISVAAVVIRGLPDQTHRALKVRAAGNGRSTEAEIRAILEDAVKPKVRLGAALRAVGRSVGGADLDIEGDRTPVAAAVLR
jgi:plasmid stability protein